MPKRDQEPRAAEPEPVALPPSSAELVLLLTGAQALIRAMGRKRGEKFLREWAALLQTVETVEAIMPIRPKADRAALAKSQREALAWFRRALPSLVDVMPER